MSTIDSFLSIVTSTNLCLSSYKQNYSLPQAFQARFLLSISISVWLQGNPQQCTPFRHKPYTIFLFFFCPLHLWFRQISLSALPLLNSLQIQLPLAAIFSQFSIMCVCVVCVAWHVHVCVLLCLPLFWSGQDLLVVDAATCFSLCHCAI